VLALPGWQGHIRCSVMVEVRFKKISCVKTEVNPKWCHKDYEIGVAKDDAATVR